MSTLAELIEDGKRLEAMERDATSYSALADARTLLQDLYIVNGPRLLSVAEAGAKMRKTLDALEYAGTSPRLSADVAAFDAAASGEARG